MRVDVSSLLSVAWRRTLDMVFPPRCVGCGEQGAFLCRACVEAMPRALPPRCPLCWQPERRGEMCRRCAQARPAFEGTRTLYLFEGPVREAVHALKYNHLSALARPMGEMMAAYLEEEVLPVELVVPDKREMTRRLEALTHKRNQRVKAYLHLASRRIIDHIADFNLVYTENLPKQLKLELSSIYLNITST